VRLMMYSRTKADIKKLIQYSESIDSKVSENSREALRSLIDQGEAIGHLVQYYSKTQSSTVLDLLCRVKEPNDTELCNRIQEFMDGSPLATIILLGQIVQKAPSWLTKLVDHSVFNNLLKLIHSSNNTVVVVAGLLFISSLLPYCSTLKRPLLNDLFAVLLTSCSLLHKRKKAFEKATSDCIEGLYVSHLYCGITQYFVLLYGIYPTNLLSFLREHYVKGRERRAFSVLESIISCVKFHPQLFKMNADEEVDRNRWSQREAHDFLADCRHVLVRPTVVSAMVNVKEHISPSRSARSSSVTRMNRMRSTASIISSSHSFDSSSNTKSTDSNWDDTWSPSINLGIETPPETRTTTPLAHRTNTISNSTILPGSVSSRRSTAASDEIRRPIRRQSFSHKLTEIFRGRPRTSEVKDNLDHNLDHRSSLSIEKILAATKEETEETENIEVIDARAEISRRDSEISQVEEGLDATEICLSPSSTLSHRTATEHASSTVTPTMIESGEEDSDRLMNSNRASGMGETGNRLDTEVTKALRQSSAEVVVTSLQRSRSASSVQHTICERDQDVTLLAPELNEHTSSGTTELDDAIGTNESGTGSVNNGRSNRFSLSSFFRVVNRQRFTSECPPPAVFMNRTTPANRTKRRYKSTSVHRISSCPDLSEREQIRESLRKLEAPITANKSRVKRPLTATQIAEAIEKEFPYLTFLKTLPLGNIDEESIDVELSDEHEKTRRNYMESSFEHHSCLKQLGLADRLPAKIYDDMSTFTHGLSLEKQRDILSTRLSLVNHHLMYERCGRLLHAERNRRLFGRIKQQKLSDAQKIYLQKSLHNALLEREQLVSALTELRKQSMKERKKSDEIEIQYREELTRSRHESEKYIKELDKVGHRVAKLTEVNEQLQFDIDTMRRRCENAEVQLSLAEAKIAELENMKPELQKAYRANQELKDKIAQCEAYVKGVNTARAVELSTLGERDDQQLLAQIAQLKMDLKKERNLKDAAKTKTAEMEEEWKEERQRVNDLKMMLERAATLHIQQSEAAQHKFLSLLSVCQKQQAHILDLNTHIEKLMYSRRSPTNEATPMAIPRSTVPDEILSYDSSVCGSDNTPFFPPDLFAAHASYSAETNDAGTRDTSTGTVIIAPERNDDRHRLQSGTL
uniref:Hamartin n=5 Tax=Parascaris univalens TaxID=6257 RepID=A0A915C9K1_PARUN